MQRGKTGKLQYIRVEHGERSFHAASYRNLAVFEHVPMLYSDAQRSDVRVSRFDPFKIYMPFKLPVRSIV